MSSSCYAPCQELDRCNQLIEDFFQTGQYQACFQGHLPLAQQGYPLAECQVGYFYMEGLGVEKDIDQAFYWTQRAAQHGDRDGQYNLGWFYETGLGTDPSMELAKRWYRQAALQNHDLALEKCRDLGVALN